MPLPDLKIPETLGACADLLYDIKERRRTLEGEAEEWHKHETALTEHIIRVMPKSDSGAMGKHHKVQVVTRVKPRVSDWAAFFEYIRKTRAFELLQRRIADGAIQERWDAKKKVPGVETFNVVTLSLTKV
jgi:hypothetical protein